MTDVDFHRLELAGRKPIMPGQLSVGEAVARIVAQKATIRQERLSGIHNPWGHAIGLTDPWTFLGICESQAVVDEARSILGPDIILWDSELFPEARKYAQLLREGREGRYWPVRPLAGAIVVLGIDEVDPRPEAISLNDVQESVLDRRDPLDPIYVIRLLPATSHFDRNPLHPAHRACMEEQVLINYANRPLWLLSGVDRANNDLVTGFSLTAPAWASSGLPAEKRGET
ncbi:resolvase [Bradyrhizobium liaoningense]|uniref:resolvase n=1 Tax=Bradyrhizobium liaoningense TaxID=43992 RepID=UPI001BAAD660|nr:resolvase [Bradyrhizobium liaoningense]MBR0857849.1 resolvase [Bradyrhizobium liaoningense]